MVTSESGTEKLCFIIGIGRSGTTILNKMLNGLTDVHCMPEANFLVFFLSRFRHKTTFTSTDIDTLFDQINTYALSHPWVGWTFDPVLAKTHVLNRLRQDPAPGYGALCCVIYRHFKVNGYDKSGATVLVDKNPSYTIFTKEILEQYPDARFIWMIRDYRANVLSRKQSAFLKSPDVAYNAIRWKLYNKRALHFSEQHPDRVLAVKYETLVTDYQNEMERIIRFLDVSDRKEEEITRTIDLDAYEVAAQYRERFLKKYSDLNRPVNADRLYSWKQQLSPEEIRICDTVCGGIGTKLGYERMPGLTRRKQLAVYISHLPAIARGYADILKDRILYKLPGSWKLKRLKKKYIEFGFIEK